MLFLVLSFLASLIPLFLLFFWLRGQKNTQEIHRDQCKKALGRGMLAVLPVVLTSAVLHIGWRLLKLPDGMMFKAFYAFVVLAFSEELWKFIAFKRVIKDHPASWLEMAIYSSIVGLGFEILEAVEYAFGSNSIQMIVRGVTAMHAGYGFLTGYFYGKGKAQNKPLLKMVGFVFSWLMHGLYDFGLTDELLEMNDNFAFISVSLAIFALVILIWLISFVRKARKREECTCVLV